MNIPIQEKSVFENAQCLESSIRTRTATVDGRHIVKDDEKIPEFSWDWESLRQPQKK